MEEAGGGQVTARPGDTYRDFVFKWIGKPFEVLKRGVTPPNLFIYLKCDSGYFVEKGR